MKLQKPPVFIFLVLFAGCCFLSTCTYEKAMPTFNGYPDEVGKLIYTKCATAGCHTDASKEAAGGLSMESWESLFKGGHSGAAVIPYRSDFSTMCFFTNTFSDLGTVIGPTMPYGKTPLTRDEVLLLKNWIDAGAPSKENFVKFSDNPNRSKYYVTNQGCDVVTVFDAETGLQMRCITVGQSAGIESPHMVKVSPDKKYWYVLSLGGNYLEKYSTADDQLVGKAFIDGGYWNAFTISGNSDTAYCTDMSPANGKVTIVDLNTLAHYPRSPFDNPHGIALNATDDLLYTTHTASNNLYKVPIADFADLISFPLFTTGNEPVSPLFLSSHEILFTPDNSKYFVTCQGNSEVRVFETSTDNLLNIIHVGASPSEMSLSTTTPYLFVTCTEDLAHYPEQRGSVAVIDYTTNLLVKTIYTGWQPHGIAVDDAQKVVVVANENYTTDGPAPHHANACGGRNGYITFIDLNTLEMIKNFTGTADKKIEVSVDPYSVAKK
ncbi:MAG: hypothetical protein JWP12_3868 [Bacteroidetes bacterium]|nr:hypothetical protein [Bacteroidota bacterium]